MSRYALSVYVTSGNDTEIRLTLEAAVALVNAITEAMTERVEPDIRAILEEHQFTRAAAAPDAAVRRLEARLQALTPRVASLTSDDADECVDWVNGELAEIEIAPSLTEHDGAPLHIHWTPSSAKFDDQVIADVLMALSQELCDNGTERFGVCAAAGCDRLFYDGTRNRSRRFCTDARCASRTHTADHRRRRRTTTG